VANNLVQVNQVNLDDVEFSGFKSPSALGLSKGCLASDKHARRYTRRISEKHPKNAVGLACLQQQDSRMMLVLKTRIT
jgi:hypothetical protein